MGVKPLLCRYPLLPPEYPSGTNVDEVGRCSAFCLETLCTREDSYWEVQMKMKMMKRRKSGDDDDD